MATSHKYMPPPFSEQTSDPRIAVSTQPPPPPAQKLQRFQSSAAYHSVYMLQFSEEFDFRMVYFPLRNPDRTSQAKSNDRIPYLGE